MSVFYSLVAPSAEEYRRRPAVLTDAKRQFDADRTVIRVHKPEILKYYLTIEIMRSYQCRDRKAAARSAESRQSGREHLGGRQVSELRVAAERFILDACFRAVVAGRHGSF
jgi:hypothetical protein